MSVYDLIFRSGAVVTEAGVGTADVAVGDGRIAALAPEVEGTSRAGGGR